MTMPQYSPEVGTEMPRVSLQMSLQRFDRVWGSGRKNAPYVQANLHVDQEAAAREGLSAPVAGAPDVMNLIFRSLFQFFGQAWLETGKINLRYRRPVYASDFVTAKGIVARCETLEDGSVEVNCDVWVENASGERNVTGSASVRVSAPITR